MLRLFLQQICNDHGTCECGKCVCREGFTGRTCGITAQSELTKDYLQTSTSAEDGNHDEHSGEDETKQMHERPSLGETEQSSFTLKQQDSRDRTVGGEKEGRTSDDTNSQMLGDDGMHHSSNDYFF